MLLARFNESVISFLLGCFFGVTISQLFIDAALLIFKNAKFEAVVINYGKLGFFMSSMALYHFMEFMYVANFHFRGNDEELNWHKFLLD